MDNRIFAVRESSVMNSNPNIVEDNIKSIMKSFTNSNSLCNNTNTNTGSNLNNNPEEIESDTTTVSELNNTTKAMDVKSQGIDTVVVGGGDFGVVTGGSRSSGKDRLFAEHPDFKYTGTESESQYRDNYKYNEDDVNDDNDNLFIVKETRCKWNTRSCFDDCEESAVTMDTDTTTDNVADDTTTESATSPIFTHAHTITNTAPVHSRRIPVHSNPNPSPNTNPDSLPPVFRYPPSSCAISAKVIGHGDGVRTGGVNSSTGNGSRSRSSSSSSLSSLSKTSSLASISEEEVLSMMERMGEGELSKARPPCDCDDCLFSGPDKGHNAGDGNMLPEKKMLKRVSTQIDIYYHSHYCFCLIDLFKINTFGGLNIISKCLVLLLLLFLWLLCFVLFVFVLFLFSFVGLFSSNFT